MKIIFVLFSLSLSLLANNGFISAHDLSAQLNEPNLILLDVGSEKDYSEGHIGNAQSTQVGKWRHTVDTYMLMNSPKEIEALMQGYGINNDSKVVIYEHNKEKGLLKASYLALAMARVGFYNVFILDGGTGEWKYHDYAFTTDTHAPEKGDFTAKPDENILVDMAYVKKNIGKVPMVEARPADFYFGRLDSKGVKRNGHIKGGMSNSWKNSFEEDGLLSPKEKLDEIFYAGLELKQDEEVLLYCTGGLEASMNWFVLSRVMHFKNLKVYDASLRQWGNQTDTPMVRYKWEVFK